MIEPHDPVRAATDALSSAIVDVPSPSSSARADAIAVVARAIASRASRRRRRRWVLFASSAAAAAALVVVGATWRRHASHPEVAVSARVEGQVRVRHSGGADEPLVDGGAVATGDRVDVPAGAHATLSFSTGTTIALDAESDFEIVAGGAQQVFALDHGSARFDVAKLHEGERFVVRAADVEVEVRGTSFTVSTLPAGWTCAGGVGARVAVREGVVTVRSHDDEVRLTAGGAWPSECTASTPPPIAPTAPSVTDDEPPSTGASASAVPTSKAPTKPPSSELEAQNDLLAEALAAKRAGNRGAALAAYDRFLAKYPSSGLAEVAMAERMRLLSGPAAVAAAKAYLARYPKGFAAAEAKTLSGAP